MVKLKIKLKAKRTKLGLWTTDQLNLGVSRVMPSTGFFKVSGRRAQAKGSTSKARPPATKKGRVIL